VAKRGYSREFTPKAETAKSYLLDDIPAALWVKAKAKSKRDGVSIRAALLGFLQKWVEEDRGQ